MQKNDISMANDNFIAIRDAIINNLYGTRTSIPYFEYVGSHSTYETVPTGRKGIYIFLVTDTISVNHEMLVKYNNACNWDNTLVGAGFRSTFAEQISKNDVFYVGKVSGKYLSVYKRLKIHFGPQTKSATHGIKMEMPERIFMKGKLTAHVFLLDKGCTDTYIIDVVEKMLHESLMPLTGGSQ